MKGAWGILHPSNSLSALIRPLQWRLPLSALWSMIFPIRGKREKAGLGCIVWVYLSSVISHPAARTCPSLPSASPPAVTLVLHRTVKPSFAVFSGCSNQRFSISAHLFLALIPESRFQSASLLYRWPARILIHVLPSPRRLISPPLSVTENRPNHSSRDGDACLNFWSKPYTSGPPAIRSSLWVGFCNICLWWLSLLALPEHMMLK